MKKETKTIQAVEFIVIHTWDVNPDNCIPYDGVAFESVYIALDKADEFKRKRGNSATREGIVDMPEDFVEYEGYIMSKEDAEFDKFLSENEGC